jgi:hypothetical protein
LLLVAVVVVLMVAVAVAVANDRQPRLALHPTQVTRLRLAVVAQAVLLLQLAPKVRIAFLALSLQRAAVLPADITALVVLAVLAVAAVWAIVAPRLRLV